MGCIDFEESGLSTAALVQEIRKAIRAIAVGGQSYKIGSRSLTRANLTELRNALVYFKGELAEEEGRDAFSAVSLAEFGPR